MNKGLIFIPDISGFTEFVTSTEIRHSNHITRELIEVILDSNNLDLKVSEIEGDAVLFYKQKDVPPFTELSELIKRTFLNFHSYLKVIERDRVCQCGACSTASNLSLKFIVHYGEYNVVPIQTFAKLMGSDVILAHRLLKNSIEANEYSLFTDNYLSVDKSLNSEDNKLTDLSPFSENIESFGSVTGLYNKLEELKKNIPPAVKIKWISSISGSPDHPISL